MYQLKSAEATAIASASATERRGYLHMEWMGKKSK